MSLDATSLRLNLLAAASLPLAGWLGGRLAPAGDGVAGLLAGLPLALAVVWLWYRPLARASGRLPPVLPGVLGGALLAHVGGESPSAGSLPAASVVDWLAMPVAALAMVLGALLIAAAGRILSRHGLLFSPRRWALLGGVAGGVLAMLHAASALFRLDGTLPVLLLTVLVRAAGDLLAVLALLPAALIWWLEPQPCPLRNGRQRVVLAGHLGLLVAAIAPLTLGAAGWLVLPLVAVWAAVRAGARAIGVGGSLVMLVSASAAALALGPFGHLSPLMQRIALLTLWWALLPPGLWLAGLAAPDAPRPGLPREKIQHAAD